MDAGRSHTNEHIALTHPLRAQQLVSLNHARGGTGNIVLIRGQQTRMLSRLATHQGRTRHRTRPRNTAHNIGNTLRNHLARGNIVGHKQRLRTAHHNIVHNHTHQVITDRVMHIKRLRNSNLRTHTVRGGRQVRAAVLHQLRGIIQPREPAHATYHGGGVGGANRVFHELNGAVARLNINARTGVGDGGGILSHSG